MNPAGTPLADMLALLEQIRQSSVGFIPGRIRGESANLIIFDEAESIRAAVRNGTIADSHAAMRLAMLATPPAKTPDIDPTA